MNERKIVEMLNAIDKLNSDIKCFNNTMSSGPASYYLRKLLEYYEGCMTHAKFKPGNRVELTKTPDLKNSAGWLHCKHFLVKGAKATVEEADYSTQRGYTYRVVFDDESWVDTKGEKQPTKDKHMFCFAEEFLQC